MSKTSTLADIVSANGSLIVPTGGTSSRPSANAGSIRFNTDLGTLESANGTAWANVGSGGSSSSGGVSWQTVQNTNFIAVAGNGYAVNTQIANVTVTLPAAPTIGSFLTIVDYAQTFGSNNLILYPNGNKIQGNTSNVTLNTNGQATSLVYYDSTRGWINYSSGSNIGPYNIQYLIVAGGGGTIGWGGGGGGGGGVLLATTTVNPGVSYSMVVGAGGTGGAGNGGAATSTQDGTPSTGFGANAIGGGGGAGSGYAGRDGGSGGGAGNQAPSPAAGSGTSGQGYPGGLGYRNSGPSPAQYTGGGGGGAGGAGGNSGYPNTGNGGPGVTSSLGGTLTYYGSGGAGGGGTGATSGSTTSGGGTGGVGLGQNLGTNGGTNQGGGAGASSDYGTPAAQVCSGGSGIIVVSYYGPQRGQGGTITTANGYTIHKFTSSGTYIA